MNREEAEVCLALVEKRTASAKALLEHGAAPQAAEQLRLARSFLDRALKAVEGSP